MRNTLTIQSAGISECICIDSIYDGTNSIYLSLDVKAVNNPKLQIFKDGTLADTVTLNQNQENLVIIPEDLYGPSIVITFKYSDEDYTGDTFTINFPDKLEGNMMVTKASDYVFTAKYTKRDSEGGASITVDSELSLTSENPVQNKVITTELKRLEGLIGTGILSVSTEYSLYFENVYESVTNR